MWTEKNVKNCLQANLPFLPSYFLSFFQHVYSIKGYQRENFRRYKENRSSKRNIIVQREEICQRKSTILSLSFTNIKVLKIISIFMERYKKE